MGLDMYLIGDDYIPTCTDQTRPQRDGYEVTSYRLRLGYWRKHAPLHQHIIQTYADNKDDCREIHLDAEQLMEIAKALRERALPPNNECAGCFFGDTKWWDELRDEGAEHAKVFERAAQWLDSEQTDTWRSVYYQASW